MPPFTIPDESPGSASGSRMAGSNSATAKKPTKRRRLNFACNYCRSRKTRCDEQQPSCQACLLAGVVCVTEDVRRPGKRIQRREAGKKTDSMSLASASPSEYGTQSSYEQDTAAGFSQVDAMSVSTVARTSPKSVLESQGHREDTPSSRETIDNPLPIWRQSTGTTSFQLLTEWLDLACFRLKVPYQFGTYGSPPESSLGSMRSLFPPNVPLIPDIWAVETLLDAYEREIHTFYPVIRMDLARAEALQANSDSPSTFSLNSSDVGILRRSLILAAGACILGLPDWESYMCKTLTLARNCLGHLVGIISFGAFEVLFLFSLCLRLNDEITSAWTTLGLCMPVAYCLGLNQANRTQPHKSNPLESDQRHPAWWAIYSYEKLFAFQLGYVSSITDSSYDNLDLEVLRTATLEPYHVILTMAKVFSRIIRRCVEARQREYQANKGTLEAAIRDKVNVTGEAFIMLTDWANNLPAHVRPTSDFVLPENESLSLFISLHYHNAIIMLFRNSLLVTKDALHFAVETIAKGTPWEHLIRNGQSMVATSARKIIHLLADTDISQPQCLAPAYFPILQAHYVLAVQILKNPSSRISKVDQSLVAAAADLVHGMCANFNEADRVRAVSAGLVQIIRDATTPTSYTEPSQPPTQVDIPDTSRFDQSLNSLLQPKTSNVPPFSRNHVDPILDENVLDSLSDQAFTVPIFTDEIGCDWTDFETLLMRMENDNSTTHPTDG